MAWLLGCFFFFFFFLECESRYLRYRSGGVGGILVAHNENIAYFCH